MKTRAEIDQIVNTYKSIYEQANHSPLIQGLVMPLNEFNDKLFILTPPIAPLVQMFSPVTGELCDYVQQGTPGYDITQLLGVKKWELPEYEPNTLRCGNAAGLFPHFIPKTDQTRLENIRRWDFERHENDLFEVTVKMDGSSLTAYYNDDHVGVCSRNFEVKEDVVDGTEIVPRSSFWSVVKKCGIDRLLKTLGRNIAIQGELCGPGIQKNRALLSENRFFVYDIWDIDNRKYFTAKERREFVDAVSVLFPDVILEHVPVIDFPWYGVELTVDRVKDFVTVQKYNDQKIEGIVFKSYDDPSFSGKFINPLYLLTDTD